MYFGLENSVTIVLLLLAIMVMIWAQVKVKTNYSKYSKIKLKQGLTGQEIARKILDAHGLGEIYVVETKGELSDHYDPRRKVLKLSKGIYGTETIAAASVAAHEVGHAIQDHEGYTFMKIRSFLVPVVNFISYAGYFAMIISIFAGVTGYLKVGIVMIAASLLFQIITLPVEFNASKRAKEELLKLNLIDNEEQTGVSNMLTAAAMTYVASVISTVLNLLRNIIFLGNRRD